MKCAPASLILAALLSSVAQAQAPGIHAPAIQAQGIQASGECLIAEINAVRADPLAYVTRLEAYRAQFSGLLVATDDPDHFTLTQEGVAAVDEAIAFLKAQRALPALRDDSILALAAQDWVAQQGPTGATGHASPDGRRAGDRVAARGGGKFVGENIFYSDDQTGVDARAVIVKLIVDDGVPSRGHRDQIFNSRYRHAGAACGPHGVEGAMCVIDFSEGPAGSAYLRVSAKSK